MPLFDTHCHLQISALKSDIESVFARAVKQGVYRMLCCATAEKDWDPVVEIAGKHPETVKPALGIHPWYMDGRSGDWLDKLEEKLRKVGCAVGEIGIDHEVQHRNDEEQHLLFVEQIKLANRLGRPVSVHCRKAWKYLIETLGRVGTPEAGCVLHSYSGPADLVLQLERLGCSLSFSGSITRPANKRGAAAVAAVSADRLLIETDSPDIIPTGVVAGFNEPANLVLVAQAIGRIRNISVETVAEITYKNSIAIFGK